MKHLGDISQISGFDIEPPDVVIGGSPCFVARTPVLTSTGFKNIETINEFDNVYVQSHDGCFHKVLKTMSKYATVGQIKIEGTPIVECTAEHPFYVRKVKRIWNGNGYTRTLEKAEWIRADKLTKEYMVGYPINDYIKCNPTISPEDAWILGRYAADGYIKDGMRKDRPNGTGYHNVILCIGTHKLDDFKKNIFTYHVCYKDTDKSATKCEIINEHLVKLCKTVGKGAINKVVPQIILNADNDTKLKFIQGYVSGDGSVSNDGEVSITTTSRDLALGIQKLVADVFKTRASIHFNKVKPTYVIEGRTVNQHDTYIIRFYPYRKKQSHYIVEDEYIWIPIRTEWEINRNTVVYNLEVEKTHSYNVFGISVHNCQDLSIAGARKGIKHSELEDDETTRSGLFMEQIRLVKELRENDRRNGRSGQFVRPRYMVWENVEGAFSSNNGADFRTVLEECAKIVCEEENEECPILPLPDKNKWSKCGCIYDDLGRWSVAWTLHNAADWCVPQRRKRISLVCDFGGLSAPQILFECNGLSRDSESRREKKGKGITESVERCPTQSNRNPNDATDNGKPHTMQIRCGSETGGGKGALIQEDASAALNSSMQQTLFAPPPCAWDGTQTSPTLTSSNAGGNQRMPDKDNFNCVIDYETTNNNERNCTNIMC